MSKAILIFKEDILSIFKGADVCEDWVYSIVDIQVRGSDITFDNLQQLSALLNTKDINIHPVGRSCVCGDGACYCDDDGEVEITCKKVNFKPAEEREESDNKADKGEE